MTFDIGSNLAGVLTALISMFAAIAAAYFAYKGGQKSASASVSSASASKSASDASDTATSTHELVDGRMTELLNLTRQAATAVGVAQGTAAAAVAPTPPAIGPSGPTP